MLRSRSGAPIPAGKVHCQLYTVRFGGGNRFPLRISKNEAISDLYLHFRKTMGVRVVKFYQKRVKRTFTAFPNTRFIIY